MWPSLFQRTNMQMISKLLPLVTVRLLEAYKACNPNYAYALSLNPRRQLSKSATPAGNGGLDNATSDLIIFVNDVLVSGTGRRYVVRDLLGQGTFGQVVKCTCEGEAVAVKVCGSFLRSLSSVLFLFKRCL